MKTSRPFDFEAAIRRVPRWILGLAGVGSLLSLVFAGISSSGGFLLGALAAYLNFKLVERSVNALARGAADRKSGDGATARWVFIQFTALLLGAFVILRSSGFNLAAGFWGFLVCPAGVMLEIIYELVTYDHP